MGLSLNSNIELFLSSNSFLEIDEAYAIAALNAYFAELSLISAGVPFSALGFSQRREAQKPFVVLYKEQGEGIDIVSVPNLSDRDIPNNSVAVLNLNGVMRSQDSISSLGIDSLIENLRTAYSNSKIDGIVLQVESGGGESMAGTKLQTVLGERNKPVVGLAYLAGSAAYRAIMSLDEVIAAGTAAQFGSIGTYTTINKAQIDEYSKNFIDLYSDQTPNKNGAHRAIFQGDYSKLQEHINKMTEEFHEEVKKMRNLTGSASNISQTLSGAMFTASEAKKRGLVDSIGNLPYAVKRVKKIKK